MILPVELVDVLTLQEIKMLIRFYGTDLYNPYLKRLKEKYYKMYKWLDEND